MRPIKDNIAVGIVMDDQNVILSGKCHDFFIKSRRGDTSYRVGRKRNYHIFGLFCNFFRDILYIWKKIMLCHQWIIVWYCSCHQASRCKYRITRIRKKNDIPLITKRHAKMPHSFLASINGHYHIRCQLHIKSFLIILTDCFQKLRKVSEAVFPVVIIHGSFCQGLLDVFRRLKIRCSHTHIINFHTLCFQFHTSVIQGCKDFFSKSV